MKHTSFSAIDIPAAHEIAVTRIWNEGDKFNVGHGSEETWTRKLSVDIEILHPENRPLLSSIIATCDMVYLYDYFVRYLWGIREEPHWGKKPLEHYTYASRMREPVNQIQHIIDRIVKEPKDRQLTITIPLPEDIVIKRAIEGVMERFEPPCLRMIDFDIDMTTMTINLDVYFRSWDCVAGFPANVAGLQLFNEQIVKEVNSQIACGHNISRGYIFSTGKVICRSKNLHIYQRQFPLIEKLFKSEKRKPYVEA